MKISTSRFGEVEIDENLIFDFIEPILGYEHLSKFFLIDYSPNSVFKWLQSAEDPNIAFPITFPSLFGIDYQFTLPEEKVTKLELADTNNLLSFNIACIPRGNPQEATLNLVGPIIVNIFSKKSVQLVLTNTNYSVKHKLFNKVDQKTGEEVKV